jgi:hypothetical protein
MKHPETNFLIVLSRAAFENGVYRYLTKLTSYTNWLVTTKGVTISGYVPNVDRMSVQSRTKQTNTHQGNYLAHINASVSMAASAFRSLCDLLGNVPSHHFSVSTVNSCLLWKKRNRRFNFSMTVEGTSITTRLCVCGRSFESVNN